MNSRHTSDFDAILDMIENHFDSENEDLWEVLKKEEWKNRMIPATYAYHVTNIPREKPRPTFTELKWNLAKDSKYDRQLVGLPCVFFCTTKYSLNQYRAYDMWYCKNPNRSTNRDTGVSLYQVRLILTMGSERYHMENIPDIIELKQGVENPFIYYNIAEEQWYTNDYYTYVKNNIDKKINYFVNFVVLKNFPLKEHVWDSVRRTSKSRGLPLSSDLFSAAVIRQWSACRKHKSERTARDDEMDIVQQQNSSNNLALRH